MERMRAWGPRAPRAARLADFHPRARRAGEWGREAAGRRGAAPSPGGARGRARPRGPGRLEPSSRREAPPDRGPGMLARAPGGGDRRRAWNLHPAARPGALGFTATACPPPPPSARPSSRGGGGGARDGEMTCGVGFRSVSESDAGLALAGRGVSGRRSSRTPNRRRRRSRSARRRWRRPGRRRRSWRRRGPRPPKRRGNSGSSTRSGS